MLSTLSAQPRSQHFPAFCCMTAALLWGVFWYPLRLLEEMGVPGLWSTLIIFCSAMLMLIPGCIKARGEFSKHGLEYLLLGVFAGWTNLAFILAMLEGEVVRVLLLFYLSPIWAIVLAVFILHERLTKTGFIALFLAMTGAILMLWDTDLFLGSEFNRADFFAITSGMAFAVNNIIVRKIGVVPVALKIGVSWMGVIVLTVLGIIFTKSPTPEITSNAGLFAFFIGFPAMFVLTWTAQYGVTYLPIQRSSVIFLLEIIAGAVSAAWLTNETVGHFEYIGGFLIVSAGLISVFEEKNTN